jgi:D-alanyl-lipoteichoic acid acyltransferase DltB (MBOAT superfamily)
VAWGALHGVYLCSNHAWNNFGPTIPPRFTRPAEIAARALTFLSVVAAWLFFRADSISSALTILSRIGGKRENKQLVFSSVAGPSVQYEGRHDANQQREKQVIGRQNYVAPKA